MDLTLLLELLGHTGTSVICRKGADGVFRSGLVQIEDATAYAASFPPDTNLWFQVNPSKSSGPGGRSTANDVTRLAALWLDLDVKAGGMSATEAAENVINTLSALLGTRPAAVIHSGHGQQPLWLIAADDPAADLTIGDNRAQATTLLAQFGNLARRVAAAYGGEIDSVFDLPRILRTPGTINTKPGLPPVPATAVLDSGHALTVVQVQEVLNSHQTPPPAAPAALPEAPARVFAPVPKNGPDDAYIARAVKGVTDELHDSALWAIGHSDGRGRGWDKLQADAAYRLAGIAKADWAPSFTMKDAQDAFYAAAPTDSSWTAADVASKFAYQAARAIPAPQPAFRSPVTSEGLAFTPATTTAAEQAPAAVEVHHTFIDGGAFIFDIPDETPAVWGEGAEVLWAEGEATILCGPSGVGKTTIAGQLVRGLIGLSSELFGYPIKPYNRLLYLAMDRPAQVARSLKRHMHPSERAIVDQKLVVWKGPPPADMAKNPDILKMLCREAGADVVIIDSLKDAAIGLSEDAVGAGYNSARQGALADGVQVLELHHQTKRGTGGSDKPTTMADVYGSTWITGGAGSVILLWGTAGDPIVEFRHLKQPAEPVGPFKIVHDHAVGLSTVWQSADPIDLIKASRGRGIIARDLAFRMFDTTAPTPNDIEKARRRLNSLEKAGKIESVVVPAASGGTGQKAFHLPRRTKASPTQNPTQPLEPWTPTDPPRSPRDDSKNARTSPTQDPTRSAHLTPTIPFPPERGRGEGYASQSEHRPPPGQQQELCPDHGTPTYRGICGRCQAGH